MFVFSKVNKRPLGLNDVTTHKSYYSTQLLKWKGAIFRPCVTCFSNVGELFSDTMKKRQAVFVTS